MTPTHILLNVILRHTSRVTSLTRDVMLRSGLTHLTSLSDHLPFTVPTMQFLDPLAAALGNHFYTTPLKCHDGISQIQTILFA